MQARTNDQTPYAEGDLNQDLIDQMLNGGPLDQDPWADDTLRAEIDEATDACVDEPLPPGDSALEGVYANPPALTPHWYRTL